MPHYSKIDKNNIVIDVKKMTEDEHKNLEDKEKWLKTCYNCYGGEYYPYDKSLTDDTDAYRKNYGGIGYTYYKEIDAFVSPPLYPSWLIDKKTALWVAPIKKPDDNKTYLWDEKNKKWFVHNETLS